MLIGFVCLSQNTAIPDPNFEQALIDLGYDSAPINGSVPTININSITSLDLSLYNNITDLTGIEAFFGLTNLDCSNNQLTNLNLSNNTGLVQLFCSNNQLTTIDVSKNLYLNIFWCFNNQL